MATVGVCIVTYNSETDIAACLDKVAAQTFPLQTIVVVDNASADSSAAIVKGYQSAAVPIHLIVNAVNNGFAGGQNQAIAHCRSDYVLVLNPDVRLDPDYVGQLVAVLEKEARAGSATGQLVYAANEKMIDSTGLTLDFFRQAKDRGAGDRSENWDKPSEVFGVSGAAALYATRMIRDISVDGQFFDEDFFAYKEDVDVAWRAQRLGWRACYEPTARAVHSRGWKRAGRSSIPLFVRRHSYMNRFFVLIKNEPLKLSLLLRLPAIAALEAAKLGYIVLREPALLGCLPRMFRLLPAMLRKRRKLAVRSLAQTAGD